MSATFDFDVFLSYSSKDEQIVLALAEDLKRDGLCVWLDHWEIRPGDPIGLTIQRGLERSRTLLMFMSRAYFTSQWGTLEQQTLLFRDPTNVQRRFIPLLIEDCTRPDVIAQFAYIDWRTPSKEAYKRILVACTASPADTEETPVPRYHDDETRELSQELGKLHLQQADLKDRGQDTKWITEKILDLRRRIREGGQLVAGDFLHEGRFQLLEQIGQGGFAQVWKSYDSTRREIVAVKILHSQYGNDLTSRERFYRGARKMASLDHAGIVRMVHMPSEDGGYHFFAMEYLRGGDLHSAVLDGGTSTAELLRVVITAGDALQFAHDNGVIHRDVKPANILLGPSGQPKLTDFDLVLALDTTGGTRTGVMLGTFVYAAPEVMEMAKEAAVAADVYALGMTAIFVLYGKDLPTVVMRDASDFLRNLGVSTELRSVLEQAVSWKVSERPDSVRELCLALRRCIEREGAIWVPARDGTSSHRDTLPSDMEKDRLNRLIFSAGLSVRETSLLRALCRFLLRAMIPFGQAYMEQTLASNPEVARLLVELFLRRFDSSPAPEMRSEEELVAEIESRLEQVTHLDEDRILRRFLNLIQSTLRTNFFQLDDNGEPKPYLSFKFDSQKVSELPLPRPLCEIFVYSSRLEAVHLRGGRVARGGIRWSERLEDFRTEVLGLMKAQMVKNAVIVPVGSKGGFVVKQPPEGDREELMREVVECYQMMISGILDLTDNLVAGEIVPPEGVVRLDGDDPYLVVAADKGTATFSDIANGISEDYGYWLGNAFASGGSAGYDHKAMGITARGAWESVKRHFRERGKNIQSEPFTAVGVGDMSGDVFGNGMLLSQHMRLFGAFNHLHVFVDPDPDPEVSWRERLRLFKLPRSSWGDYDLSLISQGGGIFDRAAKSITLSPEILELFDLEEEQITPNELIRKMLAAEVELLWFGGIGTYVKAGAETHAVVGDRTNDPLRVDASEVRAKVIGEGANLGVTQRARIELGQLGCRLNTDSIDNSAGLDCSDHEVNIKILLGEVEAGGDLTREQRDELLREMTDEVGELVLRDNYLQTQAITVTHRLGARLSDRTGRFIRRLERTGRLNRKIEFLPDDEAMAERIQRGQGFTRPEIAVLLSYAKMEIYDELLASDLPEDRYMEAELSRYFPRPLRERFPAPILRHRLRREIVATMVTNDIVNRVGITFLHEVRERTGMVAADIARAYVIAREIFRMRGLWSRIEGLDNRMPAHLQASMLAECGRLIERGAVWLLREEPKPLDISAQVERYANGVRAVAEGLETLLSEADKKLLAERVAGYTEEGAPEDIAVLAARVPLLAPGCDIVRIARDTTTGEGEVGKIYFALGSRLGFDWLRRSASHLPSNSPWDKLAVTTIIDDLFRHQSRLTLRVIETADGGDVDESAIETWAEGRRSLVSQTEQLLAELQSVASPNLSMLAVANRQLKSMSA